jgi:hypothetical protein
MRKSLLIIFAVLVVMLCFFPSTSKADSITVTVDGTQYDITTVTGTFTDNMTQLESTPWWGDATLAQAIATAVADDIGTPNDGGIGGPLFAYSLDAVNAYLFIQGNVNMTSVQESVSFSYGVGSAVSAPEPEPLSMLFSGLLGLGLLVAVKRYRGSHLPAEA